MAQFVVEFIAIWEVHGWRMHARKQSGESAVEEKHLFQDKAVISFFFSLWRTLLGAALGI